MYYQIDKIFDLGLKFKSTRGHPQRERDTKAKKDKGKEKKKKKKERKRLLKSINLSALPSSDVVSTFDCIKWKIWNGLDTCIHDILRNASVDA